MRRGTGSRSYSRDREEYPSGRLYRHEASRHERTVLIEFGDYECPICARYARELYPAISQEFVEPGLVQCAFFNFPIEAIHPNAFRASEAAECAGMQGQFWQMHTRLFRQAGALAPADLQSLGDDLGLHVEDFDRCMRGETAEAVSRDVREGMRLDVGGTPSDVRFLLLQLAERMVVSGMTSSCKWSGSLARPAWTGCGRFSVSPVGDS